MFDAILLEKGQPAQLASLDDARLPPGDVTVRITHSTINYKDALAITGKGPIVKSYPMVPGIDLAGLVEDSSDARWKPGDRVLVNGQNIGEAHWGGLATRARVSADWLDAIPPSITAAQAMGLGTAGYTAMLCVLGLERQGVVPERGSVLVTGANGGVGGVALMLLAGLGYRVVASTGRVAESEYLGMLGAAEIVDRTELSSPGKPLQKARWAAAVDSVGSHTLANVCAQMKDDGVVAACGLAQGMDLPASVAPFILRGVILVGVHSVHRAPADRTLAWKRLAAEIDFDKLARMTQTIALGDAIASAHALVDGKIRGRLVVEM